MLPCWFFPYENALSDPKMASKMPKIAPRRPQEGLKKLLCSTSLWPSILIRFGLHFGSFWEPVGPQNPPQIGPQNYQKSTCANMVPQDRFKRHQDRPKRPQDPPKRPQDRPKRLPRPSQTASRGPNPPQEAPQEAPKTLPTVIFFKCAQQ